MFQLIFSAMSALNQVAVFAAALVFGGIGLFLVGNAIYWRVHAVGAQGEVIGVRRYGNCLNAVYRYNSALGHSGKATTRWRTGPMTWVVAGLFLLHLLHRLRRILAPGDKTLPRSGWLGVSELLEAARAAEPSPVQPVEQLGALPEFRDRQIRAGSLWSARFGDGHPSDCIARRERRSHLPPGRGLHRRQRAPGRLPGLDG